MRYRFLKFFVMPIALLCVLCSLSGVFQLKKTDVREAMDEMLAYHVEWHLRQTLAPLLFHDTDLEAARAERSSPVVKTEPSITVKAKKAIKRNANGDRVNSFAGLIDHLGTMTRNTMRMPLAAKHPFTLVSKSTPLQEAAFKLLGVDPKRVQ